MSRKQVICGLSLLLILEMPALALEPQSIGCSGVFGKDATDKSLRDRFGTQNVGYVYGPHDADDPWKRPTASFIFTDTDHPSGEVEVAWADRYRDDPSEHWSRRVFIFGSQYEDKYEKHAPHFLWQTVNGLHLDMTLAELEALNGKPFHIQVTKGEFYPTVKDWDGGALDVPDGGCTNAIAFWPAEGTQYIPLPEGTHGSDEAIVRRWAGTIEMITVVYPDDVVENPHK